MKKYKRNERIAAIMNILTERPSNIFSYNYFTDKFNAAKSTISEDIMIAKETAKKLDLGEIETISGASGGVRLNIKMSNEKIYDILSDISVNLSDKDRIIPGGFIYMTDILYNPNIVYNIGKVFATKYNNEKIDCVVTVEMKGIPLAMMTAKTLNVPLVIIRNNTKVTEGPTVSINYVSGSTKKIQTMSLSRKAMKEGSKVLVIDDFMKAGGTAKGIEDMMKEFKSEVISTGVLISTEEPNKKLVENFVSLLNLKKLNEDKNEIYIEPNMKIFT